MELLAEVRALAIRMRQRADLPPAEHAVLEIIDRRGPMTVPQIARERSTSRQNVQILVDRLEREGRVELHQNPAHKKSALVGLTGFGKKWLEESQTGREDLQLQLDSCVSEVEIGEVIRVLSRIRNLLSKRKRDENHAPGLSSRTKAASLELVRPRLLGEMEPEAEEFPVNLL
jgi:DNA-binding MarR family transcriptional regulator